VSVVPAERRNRARLPLRLPVRLNALDGSASVESFTENISSDGFYCICAQRLMPGQSFKVDVSMPGFQTDHSGIVIRCQARVMRTDRPTGGTGFGIGCRIENYFIADGPPAA
jgi:hypothetical protein